MLDFFSDTGKVTLILFLRGKRIAFPRLDTHRILKTLLPENLHKREKLYKGKHQDSTSVGFFYFVNVKGVILLQVITDFRAKTACSLITAVRLCELINLSVSQFPHLKSQIVLAHVCKNTKCVILF